jgi:hypothetical protein
MFGTLMFLLMGIVICIGKFADGDRSMGCLVPILIITLILVGITSSM